MVEVKAPSIARLPSQVVPIKIPEIPSAFGLPSVVTDETKELAEPYHGSAHQADGPELSMPITQLQPVITPSPPPKPQPVYSNEVSRISKPFMLPLQHILSNIQSVVILAVVDIKNSVLLKLQHNKSTMYFQ